MIIKNKINISSVKKDLEIFFNTCKFEKKQTDRIYKEINSIQTYEDIVKVINLMSKYFIRYKFFIKNKEISTKDLGDFRFLVSNIEKLLFFKNNKILDLDIETIIDGDTLRGYFTYVRDDGCVKSKKYVFDENININIKEHTIIIYPYDKICYLLPYEKNNSEKDVKQNIDIEIVDEF